MCSVGFARSLGFALLPLAVCCIMANILLFFPGGEIQYVQQERLSRLIWFMMGIGGGGVLMCGSVMAALVGLAGSGYCFIISAMAMLEGPQCFTALGWSYPFANEGGRYLMEKDTWSNCLQPVSIVEWNVTLMSILLGLSGLEFIICVLQVINGLVTAVCRPCCYKQDYTLNA
ncbi:transmembrane 4 L6 family member 1 isoform X2 [Oncorhynchus mykiss]|uniref:transmembrane 4 L6 family member 1 isoform X2 n=1 Tax=Oncorhynchus mykiss TaxID=8022 RepID=UPI000B4E99D5|nr:transmembrane 4 L6 family member 1 isoform X2 [Oncorhynchus mykiss]